MVDDVAQNLVFTSSKSYKSYMGRKQNPEFPEVSPLFGLNGLTLSFAQIPCRDMSHIAANRKAASKQFKTHLPTC